RSGIFTLSRHHPPCAQLRTGADDPVNTSVAVNNSRHGVLDTPPARGMTVLAASNFVCRCRWRNAGLCHSSSPTNRNKNRGNRQMSIDFEIPTEAKAIREKVRQWVQDECIPAEKELDIKPLAEV